MALADGRRLDLAGGGQLQRLGHVERDAARQQVPRYLLALFLFSLCYRAAVRWFD